MVIFFKFSGQVYLLEMWLDISNKLTTNKSLWYKQMPLSRCNSVSFWHFFNVFKDPVVTSRHYNLYQYRINIIDFQKLCCIIYYGVALIFSMVLKWRILVISWFIQWALSQIFVTDRYSASIFKNCSPEYLYIFVNVNEVKGVSTAQISIFTISYNNLILNVQITFMK